MNRDSEEIGTGEDGHFEWSPEFSSLKEIDDLLVEFESSNRLNTVKENTPYWKDFEGEPNLWSIIEPFVFSEKHFHDPEQPSASIWETVFIKNDKKEKLNQVVRTVLVNLQNLKSAHLVEKKETQSTKSQKRAQSPSINEQQQKESNIYDKINSHLKLGSEDLACFGNFLVSKARKQIYYLSEHKNFRRSLAEEEVVATALEKHFQLIRCYESSQQDDPSIPYFAGPRRVRVMGWRQTHSRLHHCDEHVLKLLVHIREHFNKNGKNHPTAT